MFDLPSTLRALAANVEANDQMAVQVEALSSRLSAIEDAITAPQAPDLGDPEDQHSLAARMERLERLGLQTGGVLSRLDDHDRDFDDADEAINGLRAALHALIARLDALERVAGLSGDQPVRRRTPLASRMADIERLNGEGKSVAKIAQALGMHPSGVYRTLAVIRNRSNDGGGPTA